MINVKCFLLECLGSSLTADKWRSAVYDIIYPLEVKNPEPLAIWVKKGVLQESALNDNVFVNVLKTANDENNMHLPKDC